MDPDEAPPRLRRRLLGSVAGSLLLLPVLYVAAFGPLHWWDLYHHHSPDWIVDYYHSLDPLYKHPQFGPKLARYRNWWTDLPAPRSMQRRYLIDRIADHRAILENMREKFAKDQKELARLKLQLGTLESLTDPTPEQSREAAELHRLLGMAEDRLVGDSLPDLQGIEQSIELDMADLRELDRGK